MLIISTVVPEIESKDSETGALWYVRNHIINIFMSLLPENTVLTLSGITFHEIATRPFLKLINKFSCWVIVLINTGTTIVQS